MTDTRQAFERKFDRELKRISGEIEKVLEAADKIDPVSSQEVAAVIEQLCERWTEAERERNRLRVDSASAWGLLQQDAEAAVHGLRAALGHAASLTRAAAKARSTSREGVNREPPPAEPLPGYRLAVSGGSGC
jgi:hypothetical protein